jgi:hypothetical protein
MTGNTPPNPHWFSVADTFREYVTSTFFNIWLGFAYISSSLHTRQKGW